MGTSTSFRAPPVPRWQAFSTALQQGMPLERLQSELFNAGIDWEDAFASPAIAGYAAALSEAHATFPEELRRAGAVELAIQRMAEAARPSGDAREPNPALALAERAFLGVLIRASASDTSVAEATSEQVAATFESRSERSGELVGRYLGELLSQYARHVTAREAGALTEQTPTNTQSLSVRETRTLTRSLAAAAESVGLSGSTPPASPSDVRQSWSRLVREAFERGRRLPPVVDE